MDLSTSVWNYLTAKGCCKTVRVNWNAKSSNCVTNCWNGKGSRSGWNCWILMVNNFGLNVETVMWNTTVTKDCEIHWNNSGMIPSMERYWYCTCGWLNVLAHNWNSIDWVKCFLMANTNEPTNYPNYETVVCCRPGSNFGWRNLDDSCDCHCCFERVVSPEAIVTDCWKNVAPHT